MLDVGLKNRKDRFLNLSDGREFHNIIRLWRIGQKVNPFPYKVTL